MSTPQPPSSDALAADPAAALAPLNQWLAEQSLEARAAWALEQLPGAQALSSSFGAQAAVSLHLLSRLKPKIPVILVDTGYLFPETYRFIDSLTERLDLNLHIARPRLSPAWLEARHGKLWQSGMEGLDQYNRLMKVEPMRQALDQLGIKTWYAGLRRAQAESRAERQFVEFSRGRFKLHPLLDLNDRDIGLYLKAHDLPYHPLWEAGYLSIGDVHTSRRWEPGMREEDTRFFGLKRECGLHLDV